MLQFIVMFGIMTFMGLIFMALGYLLWKKQRITIVHSYHYTKVKESDKKDYTTQMGKGVVVMGLGMILTGIICWLTYSMYGMFAFAVGFILGMMIILRAQKKYNGGVF